MHSTLLHSDFCAAIIWFESSAGDEIVVMQSLCDERAQAHHKRRKYHKIPKISPSKYKPPKLVTQKTLR